MTTTDTKTKARSFGATGGASVDTKRIGGNAWIQARDILHLPFTALNVIYGETEWGPKAWLNIRLTLDGKTEEYTVTFSDKSPAYIQLKACADTDFPFVARIEKQGRSFKLTD